jgi:hypothetical protein
MTLLDVAPIAGGGALAGIFPWRQRLAREKINRVRGVAGTAASQHPSVAMASSRSTRRSGGSLWLLPGARGIAVGRVLVWLAFGGLRLTFVAAALRRLAASGLARG